VPELYEGIAKFYASVDFRPDFGDATENKLGEKCTYEEAMDQLGGNDAEGSSREEVSEGDIAEAKEDLLSAELHSMENIEDGDKGLSSRRVKREEIFSEWNIDESSHQDKN
jgi:hypothetical protein